MNAIELLKVCSGYDACVFANFVTLIQVVPQGLATSIQYSLPICPDSDIHEDTKDIVTYGYGTQRVIYILK